ncbi:DNA polymerase [Vibrio phage vB_VpaM_sm033]|nr:DNA polymerase [Vibrio phage vB_VpaM_sm033]
MAFNNPFFLPLDMYQRDLDLVENYKDAQAKHLSLMRKIPMEKARAFVDKLELKPKSPEMKMLRRHPRQDRQKAKGDLVSYLDWVSKNENILAPNLISYANPDKERAFVAEFIDMNLKMRSKVKKDGQSAKQRGDDAYSKFCNLLQANYKIRNNSISGATSSPHNPLYYASAHTTLTSVCRTITTTANSINEKMLASNRHYFSPLVTIENIIYIVRNTDMTQIYEAIIKYGLQIPTVDEAMALTLKSTRKYWKDEKEEAKIRDILEALDPYELSAYMFCGDVKALTQYNGNMMREMYSRILKPAKHIMNYDEALEFMGDVDDDLVALAGMLLSVDMKGKDLKNVKDEEPDLYCKFASTLKHVYGEMEYYFDFIRAFITTTNYPAHLHSFPSMLREGVVASDTDSSIFTTQNQVQWYCDSLVNTPEMVSVAAITTYFASQNIAHNLGMLCAQIGVERNALFRCTMKNEFYFPVMVVTTRTKHYMAIISACEGQVYGKNKTEIKGVNLKNSKLPPKIRKVLEDYQLNIMDEIGKGNNLTPMNIIAPIALVEHEVLKDIRSGGATFYRYEQAKTRETYARPESSNYEKIELWNAVFGPKYGMAEQLPIQCVKVPVTISKKALAADYIKTLPDTMGKAMERHMVEWGKIDKGYTNMLVPIEFMSDGKIPEEMRPIIDERKIIRTMTDAFYITSECYGMYSLNKRNTRFYSDLYTREEAEKALFFDVEL